MDAGQVLNNQIHCICVPPKRLNFRMSIPSDFRKDWDLFNKRCKVEGMTPANLLQDLIEEYLEEFREELEKAEGELDEVAGPLRDAPPKKVKIRKPKKKSYLKTIQGNARNWMKFRTGISKWNLQTRNHERLR